MAVKKSLPYALCNFCLVSFQWMAMLFLPLYYKSEGFSDVRIGALISMFSLATLVLVFPLGVAADFLSPRHMIAGGGLLAAAACLLMPAVSGFYMSGLAVLLAGGGFTLAGVSLSALFLKQMGEERRGGQASLFTIGGILGGGVSALLSGYLSEHFHSAAAIFPLGAAVCLPLILIAFFLPAGRGIAFPVLAYAKDLRRARTWVLIAIMFVTASHSGFEQAGYTLLQTEVIGLRPATVGRLFMVIAITMSVSSVISGRIYDREKRPLLMIGFALLLSGVFMAASGSARGACDFLIYRILHTAGDSVLSVIPLVLAAAIFPRHRAGGAYAFALTVNTAAYFLFANLAGAIAERHGFDSAFHLSGLLLVLSGIILLAFRSRARTFFPGLR